MWPGNVRCASCAALGLDRAPSARPTDAHLPALRPNPCAGAASALVFSCELGLRVGSSAAHSRAAPSMQRLPSCRCSQGSQPPVWLPLPASSCMLTAWPTLPRRLWCGVWHSQERRGHCQHGCDAARAGDEGAPGGWVKAGGLRATAACIVCSTQLHHTPAWWAVRCGLQRRLG